MLPKLYINSEDFVILVKIPYLMKNNIKHKKVEYVVVETQCKENPRLNFEQLLNKVKKYEKSILSLDGKDTTLSILKEEDNYIIGIVNTTKKSDIPPAHNSNTDEYRKLDLSEDGEEGLGFPNIFLYDKELSLLMYEFNKNGCYLNFFKKYLTYKIRSEEKKHPEFEVLFYPLLKKDSYSRLGKMVSYKKLEVRVANTHKLAKQDLEEKSLNELAKSASENNSKSVSVVYGAGRKKDDSLQEKFVRSIVEKFNFLKAKNKGDVSKLILHGYYMDPDGKRTKTDIDFILDRYKDSFSIEEPEIHVDNNKKRRKVAIEKLYFKNLKELREIIQGS